MLLFSIFLNSMLFTDILLESSMIHIVKSCAFPSATITKFVIFISPREH